MKNNRLLLTILSMGLISFLGIVVETALNLVFPFFMKNYNITSGTVQWLTSGYMLVSTIIIPFGAFLRKRFKIKALFRIGVASFLVGTLLAIVANNFEVLLIGRLIQGIANGVILPLMFSVIIKQAPLERLGTFMGMGSLVLAFAPAVGPVYGGTISKLLGWKYIFIILVPIILFAWIIGEKSIKQDIETQKIKLDIKGGAFLAVSLLLGLLLINSVTTNAHLSLLNIMFVALFIVSVIGFIKIEVNKNEPLLKLEVFKQRNFLIFLIPFFLLQLASLSMSYLIPNVLELGFNQTTNVVGMYVAPAAIVDALAALAGGYLYDKFKHYVSILSGVILMLGTFIALAFLKPTPILLAIIYGSFMLGLGLSYSNIMTFSLSKISQEMVNDGNAIYMTAQSYAGSIGIALSASVMAAAQSGVNDLYSGTLIGLQTNSIVLVVITTIALILLGIGLVKKN